VMGVANAVIDVDQSAGPDIGVTLSEADAGADVLLDDESAVRVVEAIDPDVPVASDAGDKEFGNPSSGYDYSITIDDIVHASDDYAGLTVTLSDVVEEGALTPHVFLLGDEHLLVISARPRDEVFVESTADLTGIVGVVHLAQVGTSWASTSTATRCAPSRAGRSSCGTRSKLGRDAEPRKTRV
jgi:hypothetical protein